MAFSYSNLINSMLELRSQRLKEAMFKAEQQQQEMEALGKGIGGAIGSIGQGFARGAMSSRQDALANELMTQNSSSLGGQPIMRAQSVDPSLQAGADARMRQMPGFYTGGMDELKLRMQMQDQRNQNMSSQLAQDRFGYAKETDKRDYNRLVQNDITAAGNTAMDNYRADQAAKARQKDIDVDNARQKAANATKGLKDDFNDMESYHASMKVHENDMRDAPDKYSYDNAARSAHSLWSAAKKRGLDVGDGPPDIAPFMTPSQKASLAEQQAKVSSSMKGLAEAQNTPAGSFDWAAGMLPGLQSRDEKIKAAQEQYNMEQGTLKSMQGDITPFDASAPTQNNSDPNTPIGKTQKNLKTGQVRRWNGKAWEIVQ